MAVCSTCTAVKPIPQCSEQVVIGTVDSESESLLVYVREVLTGRTITYEAMNDAGEISFAPDDFFSPGFVYDIQIIESLSEINSPLTITIDATEYDCLQLSIIPVMESANYTPEGPESITLQIDEEN